MHRNPVTFILLISGVAAFVWVLWLQPEPNTDIPEGYTTLPQEFNQTPPETREGGLSIRTQNGSLQINDVRTQSETVQVDEDSYLLYGYDFSHSYPFAVTYYHSGNGFAIALLKEPLAKTRLEMEQSLQARLGISEAEMCQLKALIGVPIGVNEFLSGRNLGFSFCPNAIEL